MRTSGQNFSSPRFGRFRKYIIAFFVTLAPTWSGISMAANAGPAPVQKGIFGWIKSGDIPLPGVSVSAANISTGQQLVTSTDVDGSYSLAVPDPGRYKVSAQLAAFAPASQEIAIDESHSAVRADFQLILLSRVPAPQRARESPREARSAPGFLNLPVVEGEARVDGSEAEAAGPGSTAENSLENPADTTPTGVGPESVAISGATARMEQLPNVAEMRDRMQEMGRYMQGGQGGPPGGGFGGPGGGPMVMMFGGPGGRGRFNINRVHGNISYTIGDSAFDAKPYSLTGQDLPRPNYLQNRYSISLGGPFKVPKLFDASRSTFFFLSYDGYRSANPYDNFSTVPTIEERLGNFSDTLIQRGANAGSPVQIFDPATHLQFDNNSIPTRQLDPAAVHLLNFIPLPNLPGSVQNFHLVESVDSSLSNLNFRLMHNFGGGGGASGGARGGPGGRGGFFGPGRGRTGSNLNVGFRYHSSGDDVTNPNPFVGGHTSNKSIDVPVGYIRTHGRFVNNLRADFNRSRTTAQNLYAFSQNIAGGLGINGVSQNPFDWGLPSLSFVNFSGVRDITPQHRADQTFSISDTMIWSHGRHTWRWGGDFRRLQRNIQTDANARGTFTFTGFSTAVLAGGAPVPGTGFDLADFLLGLPQQTSAQFGNNAYYFRGNTWEMFAQDEWRLRSNLTLNLGLRYEYISPYSEKYNRIVNLDAAGNFLSVAPVLAGQSGAFTGSFPTTLLNPDRNNFAPRLGLAWKPFRNTVIRTGYGINYNTGAYASIIQNLAFQPPFAFTQTNIQSPALPLSLENGFPASPAAVTNNFGVDRNYRLGYVQMWNVNIQQQLPRGILLNLDYTGTKGTHLDMMRAPNRDPSGLLIAGVQPFLWESSEGNSIAHSATVRVRRRLQHGFQIGGSYVFSKSIDNASSIGGGATVVAQNDRDLAAERGLSSFDQRHRFYADYLWELPFGADKRWLSSKGVLSALAGGWQWSGSVAIASGIPLTARVLGNFAEVSRGTNGTLRADATGLPVSLDNPTSAQFFNTLAFTIPAPGQFGNAQRNTIPGPRTLIFGIALNKTIPLGDVRALELRAQVSNLFNTPQFQSIDTVVNSPSYGRVLTAGTMRRIQIVARFRF